MAIDVPDSCSVELVSTDELENLRIGRGRREVESLQSMQEDVTVAMISDREFSDHKRVNENPIRIK